jgi:hypothetical protein
MPSPTRAFARRAMCGSTTDVHDTDTPHFGARVARRSLLQSRCPHVMRRPTFRLHFPVKFGRDIPKKAVISIQSPVLERERRPGETRPGSHDATVAKVAVFRALCGWRRLRPVEGVKGHTHSRGIAQSSRFWPFFLLFTVCRIVGGRKGRDPCAATGRRPGHASASLGRNMPANGASNRATPARIAVTNPLTAAATIGPAA